MVKVSIVLPTYNGEQYLKQSIDSILKQTCTDWELILVDDCSKDQTAYITEEYASLDSRIQVIHNKENKKLPGTLNVGFAAAKGHYFTWTSDDNLYEKDAIAVMSDYLDLNNDVHMVRGASQYIDEYGNVIGRSGNFSIENMYANNCLGACFMYRRDVWETIGDYDEDTFGVEDYDYWLRILNYYGEIISIDKVLYQYRIHARSLSALRKKEIRDQLTRMRIRYIDNIFSVLQKSPEALCHIYYEMRKSKNMTPIITKRFLDKLPVLQGEVPFTENEEYIIFGAGIYGEKAAAKLGRHAIFFADNAEEKVGSVKCNLKVLTFQEAVKWRGKYRFVIAAAELKRYEMMMQLQEAGIKRYNIFESIEEDDMGGPLWT